MRAKIFTINSQTFILQPSNSKAASDVAFSCILQEKNTARLQGNTMFIISNSANGNLTESTPKSKA
jgi:hypothetical protein